ncbi:hypothetical protein K501DRAFT_249425 [Backusella circina FSU 941]|nr:hypothetical protein K501DRAFT_249425 [Backusella circina FSU 941]
MQDDDVRDFNSLLDALFSKPPPPPKMPSTRKQNEDIIQENLMKLLLRPNPSVYRENAPIPKSFATTVFDDSARIDRALTKEVLGLSDDERIVEKEQEIKVIDRIASTDTEQGLLEVVSNEINNNDRDDYSRYYPSILVKAMEHATLRFKNPYLAITIFERAKQKSLTSYIAGCNTDAYNTILKVRWNTFRDVYGVLKTLEEMTLNGIMCNNESRDIVSSISADGGLFWNEDEQRATNVMKELVSKWQV